MFYFLKVSVLSFVLLLHSVVAVFRIGTQLST